MSERSVRKTNARRLLVGLGGIGYTPREAICDIVDNSVSAGAKNVYIKIVKINDELNDSRKNNVSQYLIIDDGSGMTLDQIGNALDLGSDESNYSEGTLSKYGLGLKSASFANGNRLEIISGRDGEFNKEYVDLDEITDEYFSCNVSLDDTDKKLIIRYLPGGTGTIVRVAKIRNVEHPGINSVIKELTQQLGVIYYYFIKDSGLKIHLLNKADDGSYIVEPFDPLFIDSIDNDANLDEDNWDGKTVNWLMRPKEIVLEKIDGRDIKVTVEMTQLPHPPTVALDGEMSKSDVRKKYAIDANNYGFYVYRNRRLISWANRLNGIIPFDQKCYSLRGRIVIDESADDILNINVSKNSISLSAGAEKVLDDEISVYKRKSQAAWEHATKEVSRKTKEDSTGRANDLVASISDVDAYGVSEQQETEAEKRARALQQQDHEEARKEAADKKAAENGEPVNLSEVTDDDVDNYVKGASARKEDDRIFKARFLEDNLLWKPYIDASQSECVRVSESHRFSVLVNLDNAENIDMQVIIDLFLLELARAETFTIKYCQDYEQEVAKKILEEFRLKASEVLAKTCRELEGELPPYNDAI